MHIKYQVIQRLEWSCPGMVVYVNEEGVITGIQANPDNSLTYQDADGDEYFNASDYAYVEKKVTTIKSVAEIKAAYEAAPKS